MNPDPKTIKSKPFLKWAGSKYKILDKILPNLVPNNTLVEPFLGSGAVFMNAEYESYKLSDNNPDLINLYNLVKKSGDEFIEMASSLFHKTTNQQQAYNHLREEFNSSTDATRRSVLFVYLNRHCFNGLCRYNSKGGFNVPFGHYDKPYFPADEIMAFHIKSQLADFQLLDFNVAMTNATKDSTVYCDPPYAPLTPTANFTGYTGKGFNSKEHEELLKQALALKDKGIPVSISNHDTDYTRELYKSATIHSFGVRRYIASKAENRVKAAELLAVWNATP